MQALGGTEDVAPERVRDHDVVGDFDGVHDEFLGSYGSAPG